MARPTNNKPSKALLKRLSDEIKGIAPKPKKVKKPKPEEIAEDSIYKWFVEQADAVITSAYEKMGEEDLEDLDEFRKRVRWRDLKKSLKQKNINDD